MLTLSIDTAGERCAVALWRGGGENGALAAARDMAMARGHAEHLFPLIAEVVEEAGAAKSDISRVIALRGPGTFTGLRIGLAAARGLAVALGIPALGVTTFELIAAADRDETGEDVPRLVAIDARRGEVYLQLLDPALTPIGAPTVLPPAAAARIHASGPRLAVGTGAAALATAFRDAGIGLRVRTPRPPTAHLLARLGAAADPAGRPPEPLYIRPPDAKPQSGASVRRVPA